MRVSEVAHAGLLERRRELAILEGLLDAATGGTGGLAIVSGPAGIGKSALLAEVRQEARRRGIRVLAARGEEIEREFAFGVARQLFERSARALMAVGTLSGAAELAAVPLGLAPAPQPRSPDEPFASRHGLYWLAADLAGDAPLLLVIDDAQWVDSPSLAWLAFLAGRLDELAIGLVVGVRDEGDLDPALAKLAVEPMARRVTPAPLSEVAVGRLTGTVLGIDPRPELVAAVYRAAGGNPLWTREFLRALSADSPTPEHDIHGIGEPTPLSVTRAVLVRIGQLGSEAVELARAVAVLGSDVGLRDAAGVAGLDPLTTGKVAAVLQRAGILEQDDERLSFVHPIVREAIYGDLSPAQRVAAHAAAAKVVAARGGPPEQVAGQLLPVPAAGEPWVSEHLREAARAAAARGAPETAAAYLRRALAERPDTPEGELLYELGAAEAATSDPGALEHLLAAYEAANPRSRPRIAVDAGQVMLLGLRLDEAVVFLHRALDEAEPQDRESRLRLTAALAMARLFRGELHEVPVEIPSGKTPGERALLASLALTRLMRAEPTEAALELGRAAWSEGELLADEDPASSYVLAAISAPMLCDSFDEANTWLGALLVEAQRRGSVTGFVTALMMRAYVGYRRGSLGEGAADARAVLEIEASHGTTMFTPGGLAFLIDISIETGDLHEAGAALRARGWDGALPELYPLGVLLDRRGRLRLAQGDVEAGVADLQEARRRLAWIENPIANLDSNLALALARLDRDEEARELASRELDMARRVGLPRQIAIALRAVALIEQPPDIEALEHSAALAGGAGARLEQARALTDLGAALRREGQRSAAREPLRRALELATRSGATVLAGRARDELLAAGGRPRRAMLSGREALTPSELRIAELAAGGQSNREIAQGLFVTVRTVEMHLSAAYRKLGISSRAELNRALTPAARETPSVSGPKSFGRAT